MKSIYLRNFLATALLVFVSFAIVGASFFFIGRNYLINSTRERMNASADEVVRSALALSKQETLGSWNLRLTISPIANVTSSHIFICDQDGLVLSCSDLTLYCAKHQGKQLDPSVMQAVSSGSEFDSMTTLMGFYSEQQYVVAKPIVSDDETLGYVFVASDEFNIMNNWQAFFGVALAVSIAVVLADTLEKSDNKRQEFIANVSHELRTPMTTIAGFADGILDGTIPHEQEEKYLHKIADETRRLSRLVRSMLDLSQAESDAVDLSKRSRFDLSELLLQCLLSFESRAKEKNLDVDPQLPEDPIEVFAERDSITQVIYNLTDNAMKFASPGSTITIRLYKKGSKAYVSIKNIGEPIPENDLPYIFDRFHKSDRSRSLDKDGVGLGLYLVKKIVNSHGEEVAVSSRDGVTVFVFTLPLAPAKQKKEKAERK